MVHIAFLYILKSHLGCLLAQFNQCADHVCDTSTSLTKNCALAKAAFSLGSQT